MIELLDKLNEVDFRDTFKPISDEEHRKRNPKPNKKGDKVKWGKESAGLPDLVLTEEPRWNNDTKEWQSKGVTPTNRKLGIRYAPSDDWHSPDDGRWFTSEKDFKATDND